MKVTKDGNVFCAIKENFVDSNPGDYKEFTIDGTPVSSFNIVVPASASDTLRAFADRLSNTLSTIGGKKIGIIDDSAPASANEILLGKTNRAESIDPSASNDRLIYTDGKLVFCPSTESGYDKLLLHIVGEAAARSGKLTSESLAVNSLSNELVKTITFGALLFTETTDGLQVNKCTAEQIAAWGGHDKTTQASASTGIRLDLLTDSSHFYFKGTPSSVFELFINGELVSQSKDGVIDVELDNSKGENRVTVLFPNHDANVCIQQVNIDDGASVTPHTYDRKFLILGDSITQGKTSSASSISYANQISMMFNADSVIQGISGGRFFADTLDPNADFDPDYIFVAFGTNDWSWGRPDEATYIQYMREYFEKLRRLYPDATIFGLAPIWRQDNSPSNVGDFETARQLLMDEVEAIGGIAIDCIDFVPHESKYYADSNCLHPNDAGFEHYSKNLYEAVKDHIK
jgi:lysophospholipase L1-like esterase